ncbi:MULTISPECIES: DUF4097 family beta strand repeat-containing protein [Streptomyces]|uniref:DUF4097 family beta strand repeat-containing protein n=2 Tax=Streptomyces TaxID=1883 RepID=A0ABU4JZ79_9ACTN|nr:DUF4097 family beta strand repeat-containing protein [Streptomyces roseolus]MDX2290795.1 DUF4097 family beta strand repeat-containing protein [Streptomyces roseolus]
MQTFATTAPITTVVDIPAGHLRFIAADRADTTVDIRPANAAKSRDVKAAEDTTAAFADGVLRITAPAAKNQLFGQTGFVDVTVQLPAGSSVQATAATADLRGAGRLGDVTFEAAQGPATLEEAGTVRVSLQDGDITVGRLNGSADLATARGDLTVDQAGTGVVTLTTQAGSIAVGAAPGVSATLDAHTTLGRIQNSLQNSQGADASLTIRATTALGDITAHSK